jgi:hypothetical protein
MESRPMNTRDLLYRRYGFPAEIVIVCGSIFASASVTVILKK